MRYINILFLLIIFYQTASSQDTVVLSDNRHVFNLSPSIFINKGKFGSFSYAINNSTYSPSNDMYQWHIGNYRKRILIDEFRYSVSIKRFSFSIANARVQGLSYNSIDVNDGSEYQRVNHFYELSYKIILSKRKYRPDFGAGIIVGDNPLFVSLGNTREKFKYYFTISFCYFYIPIPNTCSYGVSYRFFKNLDLSIELNHKNHKINRALLMLNYDLTKYFSFQAGIYHYDYDFKDYIPFDNWEQAGRNIVLDINNKASYNLLSAKVILHLGSNKK